MGSVLAAAEMAMQPLSTDELISVGRPYLEAIVHGLCLAATDLTGQPAAATGLSVKSELPTAPGSAGGEEFFRLTFSISSGEEASTTLHWIVPGSLVALIVPPEAAEELDLEAVGGASRGGQVTDERLELLLDIPLEITVELGRVNMEVRDVLALTAGSIVEISKAAGEPVDVLVNGRPVARGEVVVIEDNFGVRITEILSPRDRLNRLQGAA
jgi:flagellar motor switch protein FliN/FliY